MPRNSTGVYSLPTGYLAVSGQTAKASQHNPPLEDIATALTQSVASDGRTPMTGALTLSGDPTLPLHAAPKQYVDALTSSPWTDLASAATTDLSTVTGENIRVTGTVTITSLGTAASGVTKLLRFAASLTITHNATSLICLGNANIITAVGDFAEVRSLGSGNWVMTRYERFSGLGAWTTVASAATVDLGAQTSRNIALSGTTGVTSFGSTPTPDNVPFNIRSTGAITITHSANLICPGNANLTLAAGDTFTVVQEATGVWRIITYSLSALPAISGANLTGLAGGTPAGVVAPFAGSSAPSGWLLCSGGTANRTTFAALFAIIGTTYGAGDGSTTFGLPDLRGRTVAGVDNMGGTAANRLTSGGSGISGTILGAAGGAETFTIGISQMPSHNHQLNGSSLSGGSGLYGTWQTNNPNFISTSSVGGGGASNVTQPTIALNYIIKT
jgi:microcystin-dependent protein